MKFALAPVLLLAAAVAYGQGRPTNGEAADVRIEMKTATGENAGTATITETPHGLLIHYTPMNVPAGTHAVHLHETGRCDAPSFESAGGHFNPTNASHGFQDPKGYHAGDLPNLSVAKERGTHEIFAKDLTLKDGKMALMDADGAALVVHAGVDDHMTDPAGSSGNRIACGVVRGASSK